MGKQLLESVSFKLEIVKGISITGDVKTIRNQTAKPVLIIGHGFRGHKDWGFWPDMTSRFAEKGYYTVIFNFARIAAEELGLEELAKARASTLSQELSDWGTVVAALFENRLPLAQTEADRSKLAILGHSRAGGTAIVYAAEHPEIRAAVIWNGGGSPNRPVAAEGEHLSAQEQAILHDLDANAERFQIKQKFGSLEIPALVVQGDQDVDRLLQAHRELWEVAPNQSFVAIQGGNHTFGAVDPYQGATEALDTAFQETDSFLRHALHWQ